MKKTMNLAAVALMAMAACVTSCTKEDVVATTISTPKEVKMYVDSTLQMTATVEPADAKITWESEDMNTAMVDANGLVTAISEGECKIYAVSGSLRAATHLTVYKNPVTLELEIAGIVQKKCSVNVTPSYEDGYYYCGYAAAKDVKGVSDAELTKNVLANIEATVKQYTAAGYSVSLKDFLQQGTKGLIASSLTANTDYVMFAFGVDVENVKASPYVTRADFHTAAVVPSNMTFDIRCDSVVSSTSAAGKVTIKSWFTANPSSKTETYLLVGGKKENVEKYGTAMDYLVYMEQYYDKQYSSRGGVDAALRKGNNPVYLSPTADGDEFIIAVAGYDGGFTTKAFSMTYKYEASTTAGKPARLVPVSDPAEAAFALEEEMMPMVYLPGMCY